MLNELMTLCDTTTSLLVVGVALLSLLWWLSTRRPPGLPPGPGPALPLLGHLHLMAKDPRAKFRAWRAQYGDLFSFYLGGRLIVVLNGFSVIQEALVKLADVFSERPHGFITDRLSKQTGILFSSGPLWKEQRKTGLEILREMGMGKNVLAEKIQEEVTHFIRTIEDEQGEPVDLTWLTMCSVSNNICSIVFGQRFQYDDPAIISNVKRVSLAAEKMDVSGVLDFLPFAEKLPGDPFCAKELLGISHELEIDFLQPHIDRHKLTYQEGEAEDFIHAYLRQMKIMEDSGKETTLGNANLLRCTWDLFAAGTETTSTAIRWTLLYFLHYPEVQDKCFKEISDVIGTHRPPCIQDKAKLTYLEATIMETLRIANIVPLSVPHGLSSDVTFRDFVIPKDAFIVPNLHSVLHDLDIWVDPENFRPERFISPDGKLTRPEQFIPFGIGRRLCLGETLARMELFLYLSAMIQRLHFLPADPEELPSLEGMLGIVHQPKPYKIRAVARE